MPLVTGLGVTRDKAEKAVSKSAGDMAEGETVWFYAKCVNNFRPVLDAVAVTSHRVLGLVSGMGNHACPYQAAVETITDERRGRHDGLNLSRSRP